MLNAMIHRWFFVLTFFFVRLIVLTSFSRYWSMLSCFFTGQLIRLAFLHFCLWYLPFFQSSTSYIFFQLEHIPFHLLKLSCMHFYPKTYAIFTLTVVAFANKLFLGRLVCAVSSVSLNHKMQITYCDANATKDRQHVLVPKREKDHLVILKKRSYANPTKQIA